ncbi:hypothetical protein MRX96_054139 [Rhipicephalus microplus]
MALFERCHSCQAACKVQYRSYQAACTMPAGSTVKLTVGSLLRITATGPPQLVLSWESQPMLNRKAVCNILLAGAILLSGSNPKKVLCLLSSIEWIGQPTLVGLTDRVFYTSQKEKAHSSDLPGSSICSNVESSGLRAGAPVPLFLQVPAASDHEASTVTLQTVGHAPIGYIKRRPRIDIIQSGSGSRRWLD